MPLSWIASNLPPHHACRRRRLNTPRAWQQFLPLLLLLLVWPGCHAHLLAQGLPAGQALGSAAAAQAHARRFGAGRQPAAPAASPQAATKTAAPPGQPHALSNSAAAWTPVGPAVVTTSLYGPVTGRITSLALDSNDSTGNTLWVGTSGGGVWRSQNAAAAAGSVSIVPLTDTLPVFAANAGSSAIPSLFIGAVAVQPAPNPVILAGTGDPNDATDSFYGEGLLRSADAGQTWTLIQISQDGANGTHSFAGLATAGIAWSSATPTLAVAALSTSTEGYTVGAQSRYAEPGLYFSTDAGVTWSMATVMNGSQIIQQPTPSGTTPISVIPTAVVWNPKRAAFFAAIAAHGYYTSSDGQTWTRLTNQPGSNLSTSQCPAGLNGAGSASCPILRGALTVQPATGDMYALTVDRNGNDQGLWQDLCAANGASSCASTTPTFASRIDNGALEAGQGAAGGSTQIAQGTYNLSLAAAPGQNGGTVLFAGVLDLYRCSLVAGGSSCTWRNTTNAGNGCNAPAGVAPAQHALVAQAQSNGYPLLFLGNDGGLWRSADGIAQTGSVCASTDATHFQNLNNAIGSGGSLAEVVGLASDPSSSNVLLAGLGELGTSSSAGSGSSGAWQQVSDGEGGFPLIDANAPANWFVSIGAGVNVRGCTLGSACTQANFTGSADIGAVQTAYDAALLDPPLLLDPQLTSSLLTGTCRVWRGPATGGSSWSNSNALGGALDGSALPCTTASTLIRAVAAGGPAAITGAVSNQGSRVLYAGTAGTTDGGGSKPGHVFMLKDASTASSTTTWTDISGSTVTNNTAAFNASAFDISSLTVDPHDTTGATVYATIMGFGTGPHLYRSLDFGAHWTNLTANLPAVPANALVVDPNDANTVYLALDSGVYATSAIATCSSQSCWGQLGSALPNAPVTQLEAEAGLPTGDGRVGLLRAGTYGRGIWQTPLLTAHSALQPQLTASPAALSFLSQPVGTQSDVLTITLTSYGNAPASVTTLSLTGDFAETDTCAGQTVAAGATCTVSVRFAPTATGGRSGLLTVYANIPGGQLTVPLSGTGSAPASMVLTPLQLDFGAVGLNQTSPARIITLSNTGGNTATIQSATVTGDFLLAANTCGTSLAADTGCSFSLAFKPTSSGSRGGTLTVVDSVGTQTAQLTGTGQSPATDTLTPASLSFTQQQVGTSSAPQQVTLSNAGDVALTLITAALNGTDFAVTNSCGTTLPAHSSCAVTVVFAPTATGTRAATLLVTDQFRTQTIPLSGAGLAPPGVSLSPSVLDLGRMGVGLSSAGVPVVLTNNGGVALQIATVAATGDFQILSSTCGLVLQPAAACTLQLGFTPTLPGVRAGTLTLTDNAGTGSQVVTLGGTGVDFGLAANGPTGLTVASGTTATYALKLTTVAGLSGAVSFACTGAPANAACTVNPSPAQMSGTVPVSVTLQTGVEIGAGAAPAHPGDRHRLPVLLCLLAAPFALWRRRRQLLPLYLVALGLLGAAGLSGCGSTRLIPYGGTGGTGGGSGGSTVVTTPGAYTITVTGTADGINHAISLNLTVN